MRLDPTDRQACLARHRGRCFVCSRPATHVDIHKDIAAKKHRVRAMCRRCWGIVTGKDRAARGAETKDFKKRQLRMPGVAA